MAFLRPDPVAPIDFFNCSLISHTLCEGKRLVQRLRPDSWTKEGKQFRPGDKAYGCADEETQDRATEESSFRIELLFHDLRHTRQDDVTLTTEIASMDAQVAYQAATGLAFHFEAFARKPKK